MNVGHISGGTNAGWRKTEQRSTADWVCPACSAQLRAYWRKCPNTGCTGTRPK